MTTLLAVVAVGVLVWLFLRYVDSVFTGFATAPAKGVESWLIGIGAALAIVLGGSLWLAGAIAIRRRQRSQAL